MKTITAYFATRKKWLTLLVICLFLAWVSIATAQRLTSAERHYLDETKTITFVSQTHYPPFEFISGKGERTGMCIELARWIATEFGFKARFVDADFKEAQKLILFGEADVLTSFFYSDQRDLSFDFTTVMFEVPASIFVVAERTDINGLTSLQGKTIAMQAGDYAQEYLESKGIKCRYIYTKNFKEATDLVVSGQADVLIGDEPIVYYHIYQHSLAEKIKKIGEPLYVGQNCMGVNDGDRVLLSIINKGISNAREKGILDKIARKWLGVKVTSPAYPWQRYLPHVITIAILLLLVLMLFWAWNTRLRHLVAKRTSALSSSEKLRHAILDASPVGIGLLRNQRKLGWHNRTMTRMLGYEDEELEGQDITVLYADMDEARVVGRKLKKAIEPGPESFSPIETRWQRKDGTVFDCLIKYAPLSHDDGGDDLAIVTATDISDRKKAAQTLKDSESQLRGILEANPDPMIVYNHEGCPTYLNPAFTRVFGWQFDELKGRPIPFVPNDQQQITKEKIADLFRNGQSLGFETRRYTKEGNLLEVLVSAATIKDSFSGQVNGVVVNITDLSTTRQLEKRLRQSEKMEVIGTLAGGIAHDFNNILTAIIGYSELGQQKAEHGQATVKEHERVMVAAEKAANLVKQLLTFSRRAEPERKLLDFRQVVEEAVTMIKRVIPKMVSIHLSFAEELNTITADANQINQIIFNLCTNASDAMPQGGEIHLEVKNVQVDHEQCAACGKLFSGKFVQLQVTDSGQGMDEDTLKNIFDPFFTTKEVGKGTGLGMSTVFGIMEAHNGHITCRSQIHQGTTFRLFFPLSSAAETPPEKIMVAEKDIWEGNETILVVDDEEFLREIASGSLIQFGYKPILAASGEEALETYRHQRAAISLVVLDISMPGMGGFKCLTALRELNPEVKVVMASGYFSDKLQKDPLRMGARDYLNKPYTATQLAQKIRTVLDDFS
ncbi:MAG: transporter substrate-binding domain-containing protein [Pseudomonadota bacterium]|nr:transporter substrate-binding domain-containing protein [Pseudomonadota bacterium]